MLGKIILFFNYRQLVCLDEGNYFSQMKAKTRWQIYVSQEEVAESNMGGSQGPEI